MGAVLYGLFLAWILAAVALLWFASRPVSNTLSLSESDPWALSNGHTWIVDRTCLTCGAAETSDPFPCPVPE